MSSDAIPTPEKPSAGHPYPQDHHAPVPPRTGAPMALVLTLGAVAAAALVACSMLWQRVGNMQEQLARQSAQSGNQSVEARTLAKDAQDLARDSAARVSVMEARVGELSLQRQQLDELMQGMSRSRDENLVTDIESSVRMAQQQAEMSGSLQPLVATLRSAKKRVESTAQPRLAPVIRAIDMDLEKLSRMSVTDTNGVLSRIEDLTRQVEDLPLINAVGKPRDTLPRKISPPPATTEESSLSLMQWAWWQEQSQRIWDAFKAGAADLVRVRRIDHPEVALLAPEQGYFLRENLKLQLLNARLALLSRQWDSARADLSSAGALLNKYFDGRSRRVQVAQAQLQQIQANLHSGNRVPLEDTLNALTTAAAIR